MAFRFLSTLKKSAGQTRREGRAQLSDVLISTVDGNVNDRILINIPEPQIGSDDELFRLES